MNVFILNAPEDCRAAWEKYWPVKSVFDLWQVRSCFHNHYNRPLSFHIAESQGHVVGFMPLSWNEETHSYVQFPGETWQGNTWLEQNQIIADTPEVLTGLLDSVPGPVHLRYLNWHPLLEHLQTVNCDETGYLFYPRIHDFSMDNYWMAFPGKSRKKIKAEMGKLFQKQISYRFNHMPDLMELYRMNIEGFQGSSYFCNDRFHRSFNELAEFLWQMGMLRITTVLIGDQIAAVDMGAIFGRAYTLLAGGTNPQFPGVAKIINLHHLEWSCSQRFDSVDFLCGNFNWKERFRLSARPLYEIRHKSPQNEFNRCENERTTACV